MKSKGYKMKIEQGKRYALINNNKIGYIFDDSLCKEVDDSLEVVEIPHDEAIVEGCRYENGKAIPITLAEAKQSQLDYINNRFDSEVSELQGEYVPKEEVLTYNLQLQEAKEYKQHQDINQVPFLKALSESREIDISVLSDKIIEKNQNYTTKLATIMGYRAKLKAQLESAQSLEDVKNIAYRSPFGFE